MAWARSVGCVVMACALTTPAAVIADETIKEKLQKLYDEEKTIKESLGLAQELRDDARAGKLICVSFPGVPVAMAKKELEETVTQFLTGGFLSAASITRYVANCGRLTRMFDKTGDAVVLAFEQQLAENKKWQLYYQDQLAKSQPQGAPTGGGVINQAWTGEWLGPASDDGGKYKETWRISGDGGALSASGDYRDWKTDRVLGSFAVSNVRIDGDRFCFSQQIQPPEDSGWAKENAGCAQLSGDQLVLHFTKYEARTTLTRKRQP